VPKKPKPRAPLVPLTGKQKSYLRALAHKLKPVVQIGHQGVTDGVQAALEVALERHELLKVKVAGEAEVDASEVGPKLAKATKSHLVQIIGHTIVLYRPRAENPKVVLPRAKAKAAKTTAPVRAAAAPIEDEEDDDDLDDDFEDEDGDEDEEE